MCIRDSNYVDDQAELETYIVYCGFNEEGQEIDRHFYGNGYRYKTIIRYYEAGRYGWVLHETRYYDSFGWLWMTENVGIDGHIFYEGVEKRTDEAENPIEGFMTFYQEEFGDDDNRVMIFKSYQYDDDGDFITGYLYDSRVDDPEGKIISKAPSEDSWRQDVYKRQALRGFESRSLRHNLSPNAVIPGVLGLFCARKSV